MTATVCKIGYWQTNNDTFQPHPNCPTGAIFDINDGTTFSILDPSKQTGTGFDWGGIKREVLTTGNPRTTGSRVTTSTYRENREVKVHLILGPTATFSALQTAIHNLVMTCRGISNEYPGVLEFQTTGMANPLYFDVLEAHVDARFQELLWVQDIDDSFVVTFTCKPFARGARQWLQNLCNNPGAEAPSGPAVSVFNDTFTNFNAYAIQAGGALAQDTYRYPDAVLIDTPLVYYRLDEASGTNAYDASGNVQTASYSNSPTLGATSLLTGDTDPAVTLAAASTQRVIIPVATLPTGNSAMTVEGLISISGAPAATQTIFSYGNSTVTNHQNLNIRINTSRQLIIDVGGSTLITSSAISTSATHYISVRWNGTTLAFNLDNGANQTATPGNQAIPSSSTNCYIGTLQGGIQAFSGTIDEWAIYGVYLGDPRITAHYTDATTTPSATSNTMVIPNGGRVAFGSPAWTSINQWQIRFRWATGLTAQWYVHYKDANNYLLAQMASTTFALIDVVGGVSTTLVNNTNVVLTNGVQYWLQMTQYPAFSTLNTTGGVLTVPTLLNSAVSPVAATLFADSSGAPGASIVALGPVNATDNAQYTASGAASSIAGQPQIAASGAALALGGNFTNVQQVSLFGPGGWTFSSFGTGVASGAWESYAPNCYANGPVASFGAGRMDAPPAGVFNCQWSSGSSGNTGNMILYGIPATQGQVLGLYGMLNAPSVSGTCVLSLGITEYNSSGTMTTSGSVATHTGALASYTKLSGTYTVANAGTAYCLVYVNANDSVAAASANATVWWDNICCYNQTTTGMTSMPYCELRFPQSFAMFVLSGLIGDMPAPALFSVGVNIGTTAWPNGRNANVYLGRRAKFNKWAQLATSGNGNYGPPSVTPVLSSAAYGGYTLSGTGFPLNAFPFFPFDSAGVNPIDGTYQAFSRMQITGASTASAVAVDAALGYVTASNNGQNYLYPSQYPFTANSSWTLAQLGQITGNVSSPSGMAGKGNYVSPFANVQTLTNTTYGAGMALVPIDAEYIAALLTNTGSSYAQGWGHVYFDGVARSCTFSVDVGVASNPAAAITSTYVNSSVTPLGYSQPIADPTLSTGTNQFGFAAMDSAGNLLPCCLEVIYSPLYAFTS